MSVPARYFAFALTQPVCLIRQALISKVLSVPKLVGMLHEDETAERGYYTRFLESELDKDEEYLNNRLKEGTVRSVWIIIAPQLANLLLPFVSGHLVKSRRT